MAPPCAVTFTPVKGGESTVIGIFDSYDRAAGFCQERKWGFAADEERLRAVHVPLKCWEMEMNYSDPYVKINAIQVQRTM